MLYYFDDLNRLGAGMTRVRGHGLVIEGKVGL